MKRNIFHIYSIVVGTLLLCSCSDDSDVSDTLRADGEKSPVAVVARVDGVFTPAPATRAADKEFAQSDVLKAYFQHVVDDGGITVVDDFNRLVSFTVGTLNDAHKDAASNYGKADTSPMTVNGGLYWDSFSSNTPADGSKDIRTENHKLRVLYGYCFNGRDAADYTFTETTGEVTGWTVKTDQTASADFQQSDLLWAKTQTPVAYAHSTSKDALHGEISIPYTHAMSKVTIIVKAGEGFDVDPTFTFTSATTVTLKNGAEQCYTKCDADAPGASLSNKDTKADIKMCQSKVDTYTTAASETKSVATYECVIVPSTIGAQNAVFATIENADGNDYKVLISDDMRATGDGKWGSKLTGSDMQSGVNYVLEVTIDKAKVQTVAYVTDWTTVTAETANGEIQFTADVVNSTITDPTSGYHSLAISGNAFNLYKSTTNSYTVSSPSTVATYGSAWTYNPQLYWKNKDDNSYFRALAKATSASTDAAPVTAVYASTDLAQNGGTDGDVDVLWGTSAAHKNTADDTQTFAEGAQIPPRTGAVPMMFYHAKSKLTIKLVTEGNPESAVDPIVLPGETKWVDLTEADVKITKLYTTATLSMTDGSISTTSKTDAAIANTPTSTAVATDKMSATTDIAGWLVIPQTIEDETMVNITLKDGTKYKLQLNKCKDSSDAAITEWKRGEHYIYEIKLTKEEVQVNVQLKDWVEKTGSGIADLDWD